MDTITTNFFQTMTLEGIENSLRAIQKYLPEEETTQNAQEDTTAEEGTTDEISPEEGDGNEEGGIEETDAEEILTDEESEEIDRSNQGFQDVDWPETDEEGEED